MIAQFTPTILTISIAVLPVLSIVLVDFSEFGSGEIPQSEDYHGSHAHVCY